MEKELCERLKERQKRSFVRKREQCKDEGEILDLIETFQSKLNEEEEEDDDDF